MPALAPEVSVIVPLLNEEPNIPPLRDRLLDSLAALGRSWEVVFVNDGSTDRSGELIDRIAASDARFTAVHFPRNYGQTAAFSAGLSQARGQLIVPMDGDLQNDPQDIRRLLDKLDEGYDLVSGWRKQCKDPITKALPSKLANSMVSLVTGIRLHDYGCSLKAYRREVLDLTFLYGEMHRFIPAYAAIAGARITEIEVGHAPRRAGKSKYGLERVLKVLLDLLVVRFFMSFLNRPSHLFGGIGCLLLLGSLAALGVAIAYRPDAALFVAAVSLAALALIVVLQGLLAEVLMRTYYESQGKAPYRISRVTRRPQETSQHPVG